MDTMPALAEAWIVSRDYAPASAKQRRTILRRLLAGIPTDPAAVEARHLIAWWATLSPQAPASRRAHHSAVCSFFAWCRAVTGHQLPAVEVVIRRPHVPRPRPRVLTAIEVAQLRAAPLGARERLVVTLMLDAGLRACEVAAIRGQDIDHAAGTLVVVGKGGHVDVLPLPASVAALTAPGAVGRLVPISADSVSRVARRAMARAGIADHRGHSLRRTFATTALARTDLRTVQSLLRHASIATSEHYLAVPDLERMRLAMAA